jgi:hypothetical protein
MNGSGQIDVRGLRRLRARSRCQRRVGRAAGECVTGQGAAYRAAALAFGYTAVSLYWTAGRTFLLGTVGATMTDMARGGGLPAIALGPGATVLKVAGGVPALSLVRPWGRGVRRR